MQRCSLSLTTQEHSTTTVYLTDSFSELACLIKTIAPSSSVIITHPHIEELYGKKLLEKMHEEQCEVILMTIPSGEAYKTREMLILLQDRLLEYGCDRQTLIIALGGGMLVDVAGFLAATTLRGLPWIVIPTSLLAMVDAAIGGKTGVNTELGKNLIGAIHHPIAVWIAPHVLQTLPRAEWINGFAEIIKYGAILDEELFSLLESLAHLDCTQLPKETLCYLIQKSYSHKIDIVQRDHRDHWIRAILNFGHTVGHALEQAHQYTISHGEAVALGMVIEGYISMLYGCSEQTFTRLYTLIRQYQFPLRLFSIPSWNAWIKLLNSDKKTKDKTPRCVLLKTIGSVQMFDGDYCTTLSDKDLLDGYNWMCKEFF
jgi:3-dehydroquinate synthase